MNLLGRKGSVIILLLLVCGIVLSACSGSVDTKGMTTTPSSPQPPSSTTVTPAEGEVQGEEKRPQLVIDPVCITLVAGSAGGASSVIGEAIGEAIRRTLPAGPSFPYQPSQYGANSPLVSQGKAQIGMEAGDFPFWAYKGQEIYQGEPHENLRSITFLHHTAWFMVTQEHLGVTSMDEIVEKKVPLKVNVNTKNGIIEYPNRWVFAEFGFDYEDNEGWGGTVNYTPLKESAELFKNRQLNAMAMTAQQPVSTLIDIFKTQPVHFIQISPEVIQKITDTYSSAVPYTIPAGMYPGLEKDYPSFSTPMYLITSSDVPDDLVYSMTKAIYENRDYLYSAFPGLQDITDKTMVQTPGIPLHTGAEAFYREVGILK